MHAVLVGLKISTPDEDDLAFVRHDFPNGVDHGRGHVSVGAIVSHVQGAFLLRVCRRKAHRSTIRRLQVRIGLPVDVDRDPVRVQTWLIAPGDLPAHITAGVQIADLVVVPLQHFRQRPPCFDRRFGYGDAGRAEFGRNHPEFVAAEIPPKVSQLLGRMTHSNTPSLESNDRQSRRLSSIPDIPLQYRRNHRFDVIAVTSITG